MIIRQGWDNRARLGVSTMQKSRLNQHMQLPQVLPWNLFQSLGKGLEPENNATVKESMFFACTWTAQPIP